MSAHFLINAYIDAKARTGLDHPPFTDVLASLVDVKHFTRPDGSLDEMRLAGYAAGHGLDYNDTAEFIQKCRERV